MKKASVANLRTNLSEFLDYVQEGKEVEIQKHNVTIAKIIPINKPEKNKTKLGLGKGSAKLKYDPTEPIMDDDWDMHK
ncbi:MAG: hypothetical protein A3F16_01720 [Deltaproteobacteria bacterium RIFCSPHIGHO2_12_FULL_43_9]|nr:MAG: hypothetical protein A3F16_01720 [Deltaproteobacteria bacterium RIFCSPHIGHO2_12_FULL_43_9]